jgi:hypothetical protein
MRFTKDNSTFYIIAFIGQIMGIVALFNLYPTLRLEIKGLNTYARVIEVDYSHDKRRINPTVEFWDLKGRHHQYTPGFSSNMTFEQGEWVKILYDPQKPARVMIKRLRFAEYTFLILFIAFSGLGVGGIVWIHKEKDAQNYLLKHGARVQALIVGVDAHPQNYFSARLRCQWTHTVTQQTYIFFSPWISRSSQIHRKECQVGQMIDMLINSDKIEQYQIELEYEASADLVD